MKTAEYLQRRGFLVDINNGNSKDYSEYDIIHLFNLTRISETYEYFQLAKQKNKPVVLTPIYWDLGRYYKYTGSAEEIGLWKEYKQFRSEILEGCDRIYPSSIIEMELIKREYGATLPLKVVYNGIDTNELLPQETGLTDTEHEEYILCVARVCPRKNQLALAKATHELNIKLILAGEANNKDYLEQCLKYKNVVYKGFLRPCELIPLYRNAKLHVLCSFVETPGLSSLEAGACGCNILTTAEGSTKEYFEDMALYCDPYDESDIYLKIKEELSFNQQPRLQSHILQKFSLDTCLNTLYLSYLDLIK